MLISDFVLHLPNIQLWFCLLPLAISDHEPGGAWCRGACPQSSRGPLSFQPNHLEIAPGPSKSGEYLTQEGLVSAFTCQSEAI